MKNQISMSAKASQRRSAELHSAVSQICNLRRLEKLGGCRAVGRFAECNSAIRQIKNLRYFVPRQALLHCHASGAAHRRAFTGLSTT